MNPTKVQNRNKINFCFVDTAELNNFFVHIISKMLRLAAIVATAAVAVQSSTIEEFQCTDGDCTDCIQLANITTGKCYDDPQEGDLFVVAGCDDTRLVEMFYSDDKCANASGKKQIEHFYN